MIDSGYLQAQMILWLSRHGDTKTMAALLRPGAIADQGVRDGIICALGMMGDASRIPRLVEVLTTDTQSYFRALAAEALGDLGAVEAKPALDRALTDGFAIQVQEGVGVGPRDPGVVYPVREKAAEALRVLSSEPAMVEAQQRREAFAKAVSPPPAE